MPFSRRRHHAALRIHASWIRMSTLALVAAAVLLLVARPADAQVRSERQSTNVDLQAVAQANQSLGLVHSDLARVRMETTADQILHAAVEIGENRFSIRLAPHSVRSAGYQLSLIHI